MLDLSNLIIQRIDEIQQLPDRVKTCLLHNQSPNCLQSEIKINRVIVKVFTLIKKKEKERIGLQTELLESIISLKLWSSKTIDEFYNISLSIFSKYDPSFHGFLENELSNTQKLKKIYDKFLNDQQGPQIGKDIMQGIKCISEYSPFTLLKWLSQWSKSKLLLALQNATISQFTRHQQDMKRISLQRVDTINQKQKQHFPSPGTIGSGRPESNSIPFMTNKQSVYGLFIQELSCYYKSIPLQLDGNFIKSIRKIHCKGNELDQRQYMEKAVEIIIQTKNKHINDQMKIFRLQYQSYLQKNQLTGSVELLKDRYKSDQERQNYIPLLSPSKGSRRYRKPIPVSYFERVKSQSKDEDIGNSQGVRQSLLLSPKTNQISFQSSNQIMRKMQRKRERRELQLPDIVPARLSNNNKSTALRTKPITNFYNHANRSLIQSYEKVIAKSQQQVSPKYYEFKKPPSIDKLLRNHNYSCSTSKKKQQIFQNPQFGKKIQSQQLRRNRQLMLQLLRQKNRHAFLDK